MTGSAVPSPTPPLPLFYSRPVPVDAGRHKGKSLRGDAGFGFAARTNSVPISGLEFSLAQRHYPIVFSGQETMIPVAVVGLRADENLFVGTDGRWDPLAYVPAYVRRYPFVFIEAPDNKLVLAVDEAADFIVDGGALPLFDQAGRPTDLVNGALQFCGAYQNNHVATTEFIRALAASDLLVDHQAQATIAGTERLSLAGFKVIDEQRFNKLPAATLEAWRDRGWLGWVYAHLMSFPCWNALANLAAQRKPAA
jgi:hypothetical protein